MTLRSLTQGLNSSRRCVRRQCISGASTEIGQIAQRWSLANERVLWLRGARGLGPRTGEIARLHQGILP